MLSKKESIKFLTRISAKLIYGLIIQASLIGALSDPLPKNLAVILIVVLTLQVVCLADAYTKIIQYEMANHRVMPWRDRWRVFLKSSWVMGSALVPITFFGWASLGFISQKSALGYTKTVFLLLLFFFGFISRRLSNGDVFSSVSVGIIAALVGYVLVQIKLWLKYLL